MIRQAVILCLKMELTSPPAHYVACMPFRPVENKGAYNIPDAN
jgi:hypothetical protein